MHKFCAEYALFKKLTILLINIQYFYCFLNKNIIFIYAKIVVFFFYNKKYIVFFAIFSLIINFALLNT